MTDSAAIPVIPSRAKAEALAASAKYFLFIDMRVLKQSCELPEQGTIVKTLAETRRFELLKALTPYLVS